VKIARLSSCKNFVRESLYLMRSLTCSQWRDLRKRWRRQLGRRCITWLSTVQQDLKQQYLTLPEAAYLTQNCPLWRMMSTYGATVTFLCLQQARLAASGIMFSCCPTGRPTVSCFDIAWFNSLSSKRLCVFGLNGAI